MVKKRLESGNEMYRLILMDYSMAPGLSGCETTIEIRNLLQNTGICPYIYCLTANNGKQVENEVLKVGMDGMCRSKPMSDDEL